MVKKDKDSALDNLRAVAHIAGRAGSKAVEKAKSVNINTEGLKEKAGTLTEKAGEIKDSALQAKEDLEKKLTELDRMLKQSVTEYNDAYTLMNDKGIKLYVERCRATDAITNVECLINSIANRPKAFDTDFAEIETSRAKFVESCEFADRELQAAREAAGGAGAGLAAGASVAFMAPTAAMWIATTFAQHPQAPLFPRSPAQLQRMPHWHGLAAGLWRKVQVELQLERLCLLWQAPSAGRLPGRRFYPLFCFLPARRRN